ncbi:hypothetical protein [Verrucomicrobium sp. BvORR106]|uniref:hypothetical protein n=1 Tax=Verrucomicrobium sp. BvORR106 TaxID=1403819 RepID=UPI0031B5FB0E
MNYVNIARNRISGGGEELDLSADFPLPTPGSTSNVRFIVECKAYRNPVQTDAWMKFLGKIFVEQIRQRQEIHALFIALSGVNGNVSGSYNELRTSQVRIQLLSGPELTKIVCELLGAKTAEDITAAISRFTQRTHTSIELVYYEMTAYWLVVFEGQRYTVLGAAGEPTTQDHLDRIRPLLERRIEDAKFVDLHEEARAYSRKKRLSQLILIYFSTLSTPASLDSFLSKHVEYEVAEASSELGDLLSKNLLQESENNYQIRSDTAPQRYDNFAKIITYIFSSPIAAQEIAQVMMGDLVRSSLNLDLVHHISTIQGNLAFPPEDGADALSIITISPSALLHALTPYPMIINHRTSEEERREHNEFDISLFMRTLYELLIQDFNNPELKQYFFESQNLRELESSMTVTVKSGSGVIAQRNITSRIGIGALADRHGGGYIHLVAPSHAPQPWDQKNRSSE